MSEVIVVTSGKGGVGKSTTTANLGVGLAMRGQKVVLIDTDTGLRNLDLLLGLENRIMYDLVDVIEFASGGVFIDHDGFHRRTLEINPRGEPGDAGPDHDDII